MQPFNPAGQGGQSPLVVFNIGSWPAGGSPAAWDLATPTRTQPRAASSLSDLELALEREHQLRDQRRRLGSSFEDPPSSQSISQVPAPPPPRELRAWQNDGAALAQAGAQIQRMRDELNEAQAQIKRMTKSRTPEPTRRIRRRKPRRRSSERTEEPLPDWDCEQQGAVQAACFRWRQQRLVAAIDHWSADATARRNAQQILQIARQRWEGDAQRGRLQCWYVSLCKSRLRREDLAVACFRWQRQRLVATIDHWWANAAARQNAQQMMQGSQHRWEEDMQRGGLQRWIIHVQDAVWHHAIRQKACCRWRQASLAVALDKWCNSAVNRDRMIDSVHRAHELWEENSKHAGIASLIEFKDATARLSESLSPPSVDKLEGRNSAFSVPKRKRKGSGRSSKGSDRNTTVDRNRTARANEPSTHSQGRAGRSVRGSSIQRRAEEAVDMVMQQAEQKAQEKMKSIEKTAKPQPRRETNPEVHREQAATAPVDAGAAAAADNREQPSVPGDMSRSAEETDVDAKQGSRRAIPRAELRRQHELLEVFNEFDAESTGSIAGADVEQLGQIQGPWDRDRTDMLVAQLGTSGGGRVSGAVFVQHLYTLTADLSDPDFDEFVMQCKLIARITTSARAQQEASLQQERVNYIQQETVKDAVARLEYAALAQKLDAAEEAKAKAEEAKARAEDDARAADQQEKVKDAVARIEYAAVAQKLNAAEEAKAKAEEAKARAEEQAKLSIEEAKAKAEEAKAKAEEAKAKAKQEAKARADEEIKAAEEKLKLGNSELESKLREVERAKAEAEAAKARAQEEIRAAQRKQAVAIADCAIKEAHGEQVDPISMTLHLAACLLPEDLSAASAISASRMKAAAKPKEQEQLQRPSTYTCLQNDCLEIALQLSHRMLPPELVPHLEAQHSLVLESQLSQVVESMSNASSPANSFTKPFSLKPTGSNDLESSMKRNGSGLFNMRALMTGSPTSSETASASAIETSASKAEPSEATLQAKGALMSVSSAASAAQFDSEAVPNLKESVPQGAKRLLMVESLVPTPSQVGTPDINRPRENINLSTNMVNLDSDTDPDELEAPIDVASGMVNLDSDEELDESAPSIKLGSGMVNLDSDEELDESAPSIKLGSGMVNLDSDEELDESAPSIKLGSGMVNLDSDAELDDEAAPAEMATDSESDFEEDYESDIMSNPYSQFLASSFSNLDMVKIAGDMEASFTSRGSGSTPTGDWLMLITSDTGVSGSSLQNNLREGREQAKVIKRFGVPIQQAFDLLQVRNGFPASDWSDEDFSISWQSFSSFATAYGLSPQLLSPFELKALFESFADGGVDMNTDADRMLLSGGFFVECVLQCIRDISEDWHEVTIKLEEMALAASSRS